MLKSPNWGLLLRANYCDLSSCASLWLNYLPKTCDAYCQIGKYRDQQLNSWQRLNPSYFGKSWLFLLQHSNFARAHNVLHSVTLLPWHLINTSTFPICTLLTCVISWPILYCHSEVSFVLFLYVLSSANTFIWCAVNVAACRKHYQGLRLSSNHTYHICLLVCLVCLSAL